jgi:hypothetical protein
LPTPQPFGLTMLRTFEDMGFHTGNPDKAAMNKLSEFCKTMRPLYPQVRATAAASALRWVTFEFFYI